MKTWRLILDSAHSASFNMAADAFLLDAADKQNSNPSLRLYSWEEPSITIGYHQDFEKAVKTSLLGHTPVVRRVTGGRALYHERNDITYSVSGNFERCKELGENLGESYRRIARAIIRFYRHLGREAIMSHRDTPVSLKKQGDAVQKGCFASVSRYEIIVSGQKMAASSQRRTQSALMQHGAVKIAKPERHSAIVDRVEAVADWGVKENLFFREEMRSLFVSSFEEVFSIQLHEEPFSQSELKEIEMRLELFENLNNERFRLNRVEY